MNEIKLDTCIINGKTVNIVASILSPVSIDFEGF